MKFLFITKLICIILIMPFVVLAEQPVTVQLKSVDGKYYDALKSFYNIPRRKQTPESVIAAARSAWELSLNKEAGELFDRALEFQEVPQIDRGRIYLSKGIIELQQENPQLAILFGQKALEQITTAGPLRAKIWLMIGQAQNDLHNSSEAYETLRKALDESSLDDEAEARFQLGKTALTLHKFEEAEENFKAVPYGHERTAETMRELAEINLNLEKPEKALFWIQKGQSDYPDRFVDSWVAYAKTIISIQQDDLVKMRAVRNDANRDFPSTDFWLNLVNAAGEKAEWDHRTKRKINNGIQKGVRS